MAGTHVTVTREPRTSRQRTECFRCRKPIPGGTPHTRTVLNTYGDRAVYDSCSDCPTPQWGS